jgi:hypothetical protein
MAFLMAILPLAGCEKPQPKQPTVAKKPSFFEQANQISQEELDQLVASVVGLRRLRQQLERHCTSNPRSTRCRQLLDEGLGQMDASTANSIRATPNTRLQATLTLEQIGKQLSQSEETASHHWAILVLAQQELAKREASSFPAVKGSFPTSVSSEDRGPY